MHTHPSDAALGEEERQERRPLLNQHSLSIADRNQALIETFREHGLRPRYLYIEDIAKKYLLDTLFQESTRLSVYYMNINTMLKLHCSRSETKHACSAEELKDNANSTALAILAADGIVLGLQATWFFLKRYGHHQRPKAANTARFLSKTYTVVNDIIYQFFFTHELTLALLYYLLAKKGEEPPIYFSVYIPSFLLVACLASTELKKCLLSVTPRRIKYGVKCILGAFESIIQSMGQTNLLLAFPVSHLYQKLNRRHELIANETRYITALCAGGMYGATQATRYCVPWYKLPRVTKGALLIDKFKDLLVNASLLMVVYFTLSAALDSGDGSSLVYTFIAYFAFSIIARCFLRYFSADIIEGNAQLHAPGRQGDEEGEARPPVNTGALAHAEERAESDEENVPPHAAERQGDEGEIRPLDTGAPAHAEEQTGLGREIAENFHPEPHSLSSYDHIYRISSAGSVGFFTSNQHTVHPNQKQKIRPDPSITALIPKY